MPNYYQEVAFLDPITTAQKMVEILKNEEQCDFIVCLSHLGINVENEGDIIDYDIAEKVSGIDFIIGGHTHQLIENPIIINDTKILQVKKNGAYIGKIVIDD
jgi:5'-nucleotidase